MKDSRLKYLVILDIIIGAAIVVLAVLVLHRQAESRKAVEEAGEEAEITETVDSGPAISAEEMEKVMPDITYDGRTWSYKSSIQTYYLMGIDREDITDTDKGTGLQNNAGQSDMNLLLIIDTDTDSVKLLPLSRDTMTQVEYYNESGTYIDTAVRNLCLQYAYGGGGRKSAELQAKAVSTLLYGIPISGYCAIDMSSISKVNDAVGGVTLTAAETIEGFCTKGETITLHGDDAETFVRKRDTGRNYTNAERMNRQKSYFTAYMARLHEVMKQDMAAPLSLWSSRSDDMVTDITADQFSTLVTKTAGTELSEEDYLEEPGELTHNDTTQHDEFHVDDEALYRLVVETFYEPIN